MSGLRTTDACNKSAAESIMQRAWKAANELSLCPAEDRAAVRGGIRETMEILERALSCS